MISQNQVILGAVVLGRVYATRAPSFLIAGLPLSWESQVKIEQKIEEVEAQKIQLGSTSESTSNSDGSANQGESDEVDLAKQADEEEDFERLIQEVSAQNGSSRSLTAGKMTTSK